MTEQATPDTGASQDLSTQQRMENLLMQPEGQADEAEGAAEQGSDQSQEGDEQPEGQAETEADSEGQSEEVEAAQPAVEFEIVHNGQQVKLTREELIRNAQQGFDYTRKMDVVAQERRIVQDTLQRLSQVDQVQPYLAQQQGQVQALEAQLAQYQRVDWVAIATDDPLGYPAKRAQYDQIKEAYWGAKQQYDNTSQAVKQQLAEIQLRQEAAEDARLPDYIPEWKDQAKREAGKAELVKHFQSIGVPFEALKAKLTDALSLSVAYKAMKYDQLQKSKAAGVKQLRQAPPVPRPGANQPGQAKADQDKALRQSLKKSGSAQDAMAVLLNRMK